MDENILSMNPWWDDGSVPAVLLGRPRPSLVDAMEKGLKTLGTLIVTGPRRTGKTTLVRQLIQRRIDGGVPAKMCLYLQLDHPSIPGDNAILAAVKQFRTEFSISRQDRLRLFLDEVQHTPDWARQVKALVDLERDYEIVITGSNAAVVEPQAMKHLAGRQARLRVWPMSYPEFLEFANKKAAASEEYLHGNFLKEYLVRGGFPRAVVEEDPSTRREYLVELFEDILYKDIVSTRNVKDSQRLRDLAFLLASGSGAPASINKLSNLTGLSLETTREYISHLQSCHLFHPAAFFSRSVNEKVYNPKKHYIVDTGMMAAIMGREKIGTLAEIALFEHFRRSGEEVCYWKSGSELDFFMPGSKLAVECKFKHPVEESELKGIVAFMTKYGLKEGVVATQDDERELSMGGKRLRLVPLWKMLLHPGQSRHGAVRKIGGK
jgi:hypothetical protein